LREFNAAIRHQSDDGVTFNQAAKAVDVAYKIMDQITKYEK